MTIITMNAIISIINSFIDLYLINLLIKTLYNIDYKSNKVQICFEFIMLTIANYLKFKYCIIKIIILGFLIIIKSKNLIIRIDKKLYLTICFIILKYPFEQLCLYFFYYILDNQLSYYANYLHLLGSVILQLLIKYVEYTILFLINVHYNEEKKYINFFKLITITILFVSSSTIIFTIHSLFYFPNVGRTFLFIVVLYIVALILFFGLNKKHQVKVLEMQKINQNIIFEIEKLKEKNEIEKEIRTIKHNLHNDYIILDGFLSTNQYEKAQNFVRDRVENLKEVTHEIHTGNIAIDSIIEQKRITMKKYNIEYHEMITSCYIGNIGDYEIALLIGLALDNAIEATCQAGEHKIITFMSQNEAGHLIIQIDNPIIQGVQPHFDKTSKQKDQKNHGLGIRKMKEIVKRYEGELRYKTVNDMVSLTFLLQTNLKQKS